jgi:hypothetical protein
VTIYSFDDVLRAPKSIHSFELSPGGKRIALWRPVPWVGLLYFIVVEIAFLIAERIIPFTAIFDLVMATEAAWITYHLLLPIGGVWLAMNAELDGRRPHMWAISILHWASGPRRTMAGQRIPVAGSKIAYGGRVRVFWDVTAPRLHHGWVKGGKVSTSLPVRFTHSVLHRRSVIAPGDSQGVMLDQYEVSNRLEVRT